MNANDIKANAKRLEELEKEIKEIENVKNFGSGEGYEGYRIMPKHYNYTLWVNEEENKIIDKIIERTLLKSKNEIHKICGEPLEEIQEEKTNYEKFDAILKDINKDEFENREDKIDLICDYLKDYAKIRKLVEDYYDDIEMLRYKEDGEKDSAYNYHRNIKSLFEDIKKVYERENDLLAFYDDLHDEIKSAIRDIDKRLTDIDEEVDKITGYVDNNR